MNAQFFFYRSDGLLKRINLDDIIYLEANNNYVKFYTADCFHLIRISLEAALNQLPADQFVQIHRSFAISIHHLDIVRKGSVSFTGDPKDALIVSKSFYAGLIGRIKIIDAGVGE